MYNSIINEEVGGKYWPLTDCESNGRSQYARLFESWKLEATLLPALFGELVLGDCF